jgi:hypothetical protein
MTCVVMMVIGSAPAMPVASRGTPEEAAAFIATQVQRDMNDARASGKPSVLLFPMPAYFIWPVEHADG